MISTRSPGRLMRRWEGCLGSCLIGALRLSAPRQSTTSFAQAEPNLEGVNYTTHPDKTSADRAEFLELVLVLLNRCSVEITLASQSDGKLTRDQFSVAVRLIHSACVLGTLIPDLVKEQSIRLPYAFPLARMFYERLLCAAYVLSDSGKAAERAILYSVLKAFKDQKSLFSFGGYKEVIPQRYKLPRNSRAVQNAVKYFKGAKSSEEYEHSRIDRCKIIGKLNGRAGSLFLSAEQAGHSVSSEVVHGSYLSTVLFSQTPRDNTLEHSFDEATLMIMTLLMLPVEGLGRVLVDLFPSHPSPPLLIQAGMTFMKMELPRVRTHNQ